MPTAGWKGQIPSLLRLAAPVVGLNLMTVLSLFVDNAMCGRLENNEIVLAALGYATSLVFLALVAMMGLSVGTVAMVARSIGSDNKERASEVLRQSLVLTVGISTLVAVVGIVLGPALLDIMGAEKETSRLAMSYLKPVFACTVFYYLNILFGATLRGTGNTLTPFAIAVVVNLLNMLINYGLIFGAWRLPRLGIAGAGYGTVISYCVGVLIYIGYLRWSPNRPVTIHRLRAKLDKPLLRQILLVGFPAALDMVVFNIGILAIVRMLSFFGDPVVAAHSVGFRVSGVAFVPGLSVSQAAAAIVGTALGAKDTQKAKDTLGAAVSLCLLIMTTLAFFTTFFAPNIVAIFDIDPTSESFTPAVTWIRILGICMPIFGVHIALNGLFQGAGATWITLRINVLVTLLIQVPLSAILGFVFGLGPAGVWAGFPLAFTVKMFVLGWLYKKESWIKLGKDAVGAR